MIKKYKIACCVLGAIVLVLILTLAITVFVFAGNIKAADGVPVLGCGDFGFDFPIPVQGEIDFVCHIHLRFVSFGLPASIPAAATIASR